MQVPMDIIGKILASCSALWVISVLYQLSWTHGCASVLLSQWSLRISWNVYPVTDTYWNCTSRMHTYRLHCHPNPSHWLQLLFRWVHSSSAYHLVYILNDHRRDDSRVGWITDLPKWCHHLWCHQKRVWFAVKIYTQSADIVKLFIRSYQV